MAFQTDLDSLVRLFSGLLLAALGVWALFLRPRRTPALLFATFTLSFGLLYISRNVAAPEDPWRDVLWIPEAILLLSASVSLFALACVFPTRLRDRGRLWLPIGVALVGWIASEAAAVGMFDVVSVFQAGRWPAIGSALIWPLLSLVLEGFVVPFAVLLQALRYDALRGDENQPYRRRIALFSGALCLYPPIEAADNFGPAVATGTLGILYVAGRLLPFLVLTAFWLRNTSVGGPADRRVARNLALLPLLMLLVGAVSMLDHDAQGPEKGIARILMVAVLAYSILRHQLLGIDVQVKWTIRQGTIAAAFVAVFFIASELAATFLSARFGPVIGISAVGLLVFALAPLQRAAERLAAAAVPDVAAMNEAQRLSLYREQAAAAWSDGRLSAKEREILEVARRQLGIDVEKAHEIELDVSRSASA